MDDSASTQPSGSAQDIADWNRIARRLEPAPIAEDRVYQQFEAVLWESLGDLEGRDVLDAGCGKGWLSKLMDDAGARVWGVDGSGEMIRQARSVYPEIEFTEYDLTQGLPPTERTFDRIVAYMVLMDLPDIRPLVNAVSHALKPTGKFIFTLPHPCFFNYRTGRDETTGQMYRKITGYLKPEVWRIDSFGGHNHYHRSLTYYCEHLRRNQLAITRLYEPRHIPGDHVADREFFANIPVFLLIETALLIPEQGRIAIHPYKYPFKKRVISPYSGMLSARGKVVREQLHIGQVRRVKPCNRHASLPTFATPRATAGILCRPATHQRGAHRCK